MNFYFYTNVSFEDWNWMNSIEKGIGGSETSIVEMSWRLANKGHNVTVYAPIPKNSPNEWRNTKWFRYEKATFKEEGVWILYRCPDIADKFASTHDKQQIWLMWQDWDYPNFNKKRLAKIDKHITLCKAHGKYILSKYPDIKKEKLWLSSNGIKLELIEEIERENIERNPKRMMYASSPDRGLRQALISFKKAREFIPDIEFHAFYGFNNLNKLLKNRDKYTPLAKQKKEIMELLKQPGVHFHGRINQRQLMREWFKSGLYIYETDFFETSHISGMEAQACGAVPIFSPVFAQRENIKHGIAIEGNSNDPLTQARFGAEIVKMTLNSSLQEMIRPEMIRWARNRFYWENFVTQWELEAQGKRKEYEEKYEFPEQL